MNRPYDITDHGGAHWPSRIASFYHPHNSLVVRGAVITLQLSMKTGKLRRKWEQPFPKVSRQSLVDGPTLEFGITSSRYIATCKVFSIDSLCKCRN